MKRFLLWSFERGSFQYDVMCAVILVFIFLTPHKVFNDRPDYMRVSDKRVQETIDKNGIRILTVQLEEPVFFDGEGPKSSAKRLLEEFLGTPVTPSKWQPIYDWTDRLIAYAVWIER